jgi:transcription elongation factor Elf1
MKLIRKFQQEMECRGCGSLLLFKENDIKVWKHDKTGLMYLYVNCISCKTELTVRIDSVPKNIYEKFSKQYKKLLNDFKQTDDAGLIPIFEIKKKEAEKSELEKELSTYKDMCEFEAAELEETLEK